MRNAKSRSSSNGERNRWLTRMRVVTLLRRLDSYDRAGYRTVARLSLRVRSRLRSCRLGRPPGAPATVAGAAFIVAFSRVYTGVH
jgi:hypothetical protein